MLKLIPKYQRGNVVPVRATPTLKKKSWESEEDYQDRIAIRKIQIVLNRNS